MPRTARAIRAGYCYHVINRGNNKARIFHDYSDYAAFVGLMAAAQLKFPLSLLAACLMPNHVHLVLQPAADRDIARWMHWLFTNHVGAYQRKYKTVGRVWQGRYRASVIQRDRHLLIVMGYVERNALRARMVDQAEKWEWGSLNWRLRGHPLVTPQPSPVPLPADWVKFVNVPQSPDELELIRTSINRQRPIGSEAWITCAARELGMESSMREPHRPRQEDE
ncbi:MAG: transposase [Pseudomonadota bacterium]